jgi:hypothetical protein
MTPGWQSWLAESPRLLLPAGELKPSAIPNICLFGALRLSGGITRSHLDLASFRCLRIKQDVTVLPARLNTGTVASGFPERSHTSLMNAAFPGRNKFTALGLAPHCAEQDDQKQTAVLFVAMCCLLGLSRVEEAIMQRWDDIDLDAKDPKTGESKPVCHVVPHDGWGPKDGESREFPISGRLHAILVQHRQPSGYLLVPVVLRLNARPTPNGLIDTTPRRSGHVSTRGSSGLEAKPSPHMG